MPLPDFNDEGDLPKGVHSATLVEVASRFGEGSHERRMLVGRLIRIHELAAATGKLARFIVFGSFVTTKQSPNDIDVILLMDDSFDLSTVTGEAALLFQHLEADAHFGASVFWTRRSLAMGGEQAMIEFWQTRRDGGERGIVEIIAEAK